MKRTLPIFLLILLAACNPPAAPAAPTVPVVAPSPASAGGPADIVFTNGTILTLDDAQPEAEAIAIQADRILAVGTDEEVLSHRGPGTLVIDLKGRTLTPGFIDSHQHRIGDREMGGYQDPDPVIQAAIEQGWTSINELFVDQARLDELRGLDAAGRLRLRVNAYLALASPQGNSYGDWYHAYQPRTEYSPYLRLIGVKLYMDHGWGNGKILWTQEQLDQMVLEAHQHGWQVAVHTLGEQAHRMILDAVEKSLGGAPVDPFRDRIEHVIVISDGDIQRMKRLGIVASIQLNGPGIWLDSPDFATGVTPEMYPHFARWRDLSDAGVVMLGSSDWPYGTLEPGFGSPMLLLYQGVTRTGTHRRPPEPWMVGQNLTMEQSLRLLTINGAYGTFEEAQKGSLQAGKLADLVMLSEDPLTAPVEKVPEIRVLMTMIGGKVEYCAPGNDSFCPQRTSAVATPASEAFTGTWQGTDPDDGSLVTVTLVQAGNDLTGTFKDTYSGSIPPPGYEGEASGTLLSATTARMTFKLTRWDGKTAELAATLKLSNGNDTLTLDFDSGNPITLQRP
jgi:predicted amidohydrolase YtcJ